MATKTSTRTALVCGAHIRRDFRWCAGSSAWGIPMKQTAQQWQSVQHPTGPHNLTSPTYPRNEVSTVPMIATVPACMVTREPLTEPRCSKMVGSWKSYLTWHRSLKHSTDPKVSTIGTPHMSWNSDDDMRAVPLLDARRKYRATTTSARWNTFLACDTSFK